MKLIDYLAGFQYLRERRPDLVSPADAARAAFGMTYLGHLEHKKALILDILAGRRPIDTTLPLGPAPPV
jgi:hypothetical protein